MRHRILGPNGEVRMGSAELSVLDVSPANRKFRLLLVISVLPTTHSEPVNQCIGLFATTTTVGLQGVSGIKRTFQRFSL